MTGEILDRVREDMAPITFPVRCNQLARFYNADGSPIATIRIWRLINALPAIMAKLEERR